MLLITGIWIGLVLGLSFIEAPLKFQAPGITTKLGLGIGRLVFGALNKIEIVFSIFFLMASVKGYKHFGNLLMGALAIIILIVLIQSVYLLPALDARAALILADQEPAPSMHHLWYVGCEVGKLILLFIIFAKTYRLSSLTS